MIQISNVTKKYGRLIANEDLTFSVGDGEITILLGPNGAGKSTIIKSICGLLKFQGSIMINGHDNHNIEAKQIMGYVPEMPTLYPLLTVYEHLEFIAKAYRLSNWEDWAKELLTRFELLDKSNKLGKELSKGMQQKVSICCAALIKPKVLILDEPLVGLDPHAIRELKLLIEELKKKGCSLIISTHMIESVEQSWDTTCIMMNGHIAKVCKRSEIAEGSDLEDLFFEITEGRKGATL